MKKLLLSLIPLLALLTVAFTAPPETGVDKLTDDPLYGIQEINTITPEDKETIGNALKSLYDLEVLEPGMQFDMQEGTAFWAILRHRWDLAHTIIIERKRGDLNVPELAAIEAVLSRYE